MVCLSNGNSASISFKLRVTQILPHFSISLPVGGGDCTHLRWDPNDVYPGKHNIPTVRPDVPLHPSCDLILCPLVPNQIQKWIK